MAESKRDYYEVLGIGKDADEAAIKKAYRVLAKNYHPYMNRGDAEADKAGCLYIPVFFRNSSKCADMS